MPDKHTTLRLKAAVLHRAKAYARRNGLTLTALMERALMSYISDSDRGFTGDAAFVIPAFGIGGVRPGVDLDDSSALADLMDGVA